MTANAYFTGLKEVADVLVFAGDDDRTLIKEVFTDSILTKFRKVGNFFKQLRRFICCTYYVHQPDIWLS